ncbi:winged helix-turn-helix domain-containing protein/riboflavin kinase [Acidiplasma sp.]|uniref:winged helix-turn-helix domain-containing protein/riboflavin kinase n=1 Tax=Acidiplasma sp. TaxID=1872114 RepID=UPI00258A550B|nr:winged helix-turn-helix domain-containing protein/riboflavin kinase [Acidiplasma sp.]
MNETLYSAIKELKNLAGSKNIAYISSSELARKMGVSQQTASRIILELIKEKYIDRTMENRRQKIIIQEKALDLLYRELNELYSILKINQSFEMEGTVQNGLGEGKYYISKKGYMDQFKEKLKMEPFPGTLNIKINPEYENILRQVRGADGIIISGFKDRERTFGGVKCFNAHIDGIKCYLIFPERSVYTDVIEVISDKYLRQALSLKDGDIIKVNVDFEF